MNIFELEKVEASKNNDFAYCKYRDTLFSRPLHIHSELEVLYIEQGEGIVVAADGMTSYRAGDMFFFSSNLPHYFKSDNTYHSTHKDIISSSTYIQFSEAILPNNYKHMLGCDNIHKLIKQGTRGIKWQQQDPSIIAKLLSMDNIEGFERLHRLYNLLNDLGTNLKDSKAIASTSYTMACNSFDTNYYRIVQYINSNFKEKITLEDIANYVNMNPSAMCRYFKTKSGQSIFNYILDVRIAIVKEELSTTDYPISQIAYSNGFNSVPNFNTLFKRIVGYTPTEYRIKMQ